MLNYQYVKGLTFFHIFLAKHTISQLRKIEEESGKNVIKLFWTKMSFGDNKLACLTHYQDRESRVKVRRIEGPKKITIQC